MYKMRKSACSGVFWLQTVVFNCVPLYDGSDYCDLKWSKRSCVMTDSNSALTCFSMILCDTNKGLRWNQVCENEED